MKVQRNAFKLHDTFGLPLTLQATTARRNRWLISYADFVVDALRAGWGEKKIKSTVREAAAFSRTNTDGLDAFWTVIQPRDGEKTKEWHKSVKTALDKYWGPHVDQV